MRGAHRSLPVPAFGELARSGVTVSLSAEPCGESVGNEVERLNRVVAPARARPAVPQYDVALSFAAEDREYVHRVADALAAKGVKVLYDNFEEADRWGKDLYSHLAETYGSRARFTAMFVSAAYAAKVWTNREREAAQARAFTQNSEYILPVRIDDTEIPWMLPATSYVRASKKTPEELASLLVAELARSDRRPGSANVTSSMAACNDKGEEGNESGIPVDAVDQRVIPASGDGNSAAGVAEPEHTVAPLRRRHVARIGWATFVGLAIGGLVGLYDPLGNLPEGAGIPPSSRTRDEGVPRGQTSKEPRQTAPEPTAAVTQTASMPTPRTTEIEAISTRGAEASAAEVANLGVSSTQIPKTGEQVYVAVCKACHDSGAVGSPKIGDGKAWESRLAQGKSALYESALNGRGMMPARGGANELHDEEIRAGVDYMLTRIPRPERIASQKRSAVPAPANVSARMSKGNQRADKGAASGAGENWADSLRVELARCGQGGFIEQVICREKARWKYCNPVRWGAVQECIAERNSGQAY